MSSEEQIREDAANPGEDSVFETFIKEDCGKRIKETFYSIDCGNDRNTA